MFVYVRNADGAALMPCSPAKARKLLRAGKAKIVDDRPFTIQLSFQCEGQVQDVICGIDKGSSSTGIACVGNGMVLLAAEIHHRQDVKAKLVSPPAVSQSRFQQTQWALATVDQNECGGGDPGGSEASTPDQRHRGRGCPGGHSPLEQP